MTILVGYPPNRRAKAVLNLAATLARSTGDDIVVCTAIPRPWVPAVAGDDPGYRGYVDELANKALGQARADIADDVPARFATIESRSIAGGLVEAAKAHNAGTIVTGSAAGLIERVTLSSIADRLLHSSPIPVAVAPRGFRTHDSKVTRVTLAVTDGPQRARLIAAAHCLAEQYRVPLRLASFAVHLSPPEAAQFDDDTLRQAQIAEIRTVALNTLTPNVSRPEIEIVIGHGNAWEDALDDIEWNTGDILLIGSSDAGPISRVFLGSHATKILRHAPVPVIVIPRAET